MYRVMIVDDEPYIRKSIINRIDWQSIGLVVVAEAGNGQSACELVALAKPDIILADIVMPVMNGIELVRHIKENYHNKHFIMLSGYDDFEYTKEAIKLKIANYIKKPIDENELKETLAHLVKLLDTEKIKEQNLQELSLLAEEAKSMKYEIFLNKLVNNQEILQGDTTVNFTHAQFAIFLMYHRNLANSYKIAALTQSILNGNSAYYNSPAGVRTAEYFVFQNARYRNEVIILINADKLNNSVVKNTMDFLRKAIKISAGFTDLEMYTSCSPVGNVSEIQVIYEKALEKLKCTTLGLDKINTAHQIAAEQIPFNNTSFFNLIDSFVEDLKNKMEKRDYKAVISVLDKIFSVENEKFFSITSLESIIREIDNSIKKMLIKMNLAGGNLHDYNIYDSHYLLQFINIDEIHQNLRDIIHSFFSCFSIEEYTLVEKIAQYIRTHYEEDLTLDSITKQFYLNPSYLSQVFKSKTGVNISHFIQDIRIEKAKELLSHVKISVTDVAFHVGYNDANYFSRVFKKIVGMQPSAYQDKYYQDRLSRDL